MANWIKVEHITPDKPEIVAIAAALNLDQDAVFGKCIRFWIWADQQSVFGDALSVTENFLDRITCCPGFAKNLEKVGWLKSRKGGYTLPHFDRHNGQSAKTRSLTSERMRKKRDAMGVTESSPDQIREEREIEKKGSTNNARAKFVVPTIEEIRAYCAERENSVDPERFHAHYDSNGWKVGPNPMKSWKAAVITWEKNDHGKNAGTSQRGTTSQKSQAGSGAGERRAAKAASEYAEDLTL